MFRWLKDVFFLFQRKKCLFFAFHYKGKEKTFFSYFKEKNVFSLLFITKAKKIQRFLFSKLFIEIFVLKFYIMITRLKQFIVYKGFTVASFERSASLANGCIGMADKRNGGLNYDALQKVLNSFPELNANWLLTGRGSMLNDSAKVPETQHEITVSIKIDVSDPLYNELIQRLKK